VGLTLGVAIVGAIVKSHAAGSISAASHGAWWTLAAAGLLVLVLGVAATSRHATATARRIATELNPEALAT
jgi:hypothetical protein